MYLTFEQLISPRPWSTVLSILLLVGLDVLGCLLLKRLGLVDPGRLTALRLQGAPVGAALLAAFLYPLALLQLTSGLLLKIVAWCCVMLGGWQVLLVLVKADKRHIVGMCRNYADEIRDPSLWLTGGILAAFFLLALAPITNADALDYHIGVAISIINQGGVPYSPEWFHSRLAGNGEVLNALGLSIGSEQFGSLLQFASLIGIAALMLGACRDDWMVTWRRGSGLVALAAVSMPVLLFLVSAPKPQLWPVSLTTLSFALLMHSSFGLLDRPAIARRYALVCFLTLTATQAKFNYLLGGGLVLGLGMLLLVYRGMWRTTLLITLTMVLLVVAPPLIWKSYLFSTDWLAALTQALPGHWPGTDQFIAWAQRSSDYTSKFPFPLSIVIPSDPGAFSSVLGVGWLILLGWRPRISGRLLLGLGVVLISLVISAALAPPGARIYLEPYYWLMFFLAADIDSAVSMRWVKWALYLQAGLVFFAACFGVFVLSRGALTDEWRETVMLRSANGYDLMRWVDERLPKNAVVMSGHRSMALLPREGVDASWMKFVDPRSAEALPYLERVRQRSVTHILVVGNTYADHPLAACFGPLVAGPGTVRVATRNPFNQGDVDQAWLLVFRSDQLPVCVSDRKILLK